MTPNPAVNERLAMALLCCLVPISSLAAPPEHLDDDEAGIWMMVDRHEQELRTSNKIIKDEALSGYLKSLTCRAVGNACNGVRVYAIRAPGFNAFMMPNGAMFVQSGLLLRVSDDAELAAVLGHEVSHYSRRHTVERLRRWRKTTSAMAIASSLVSAAGSVAVAASSSHQGMQNAQNLSATANMMVSAAGIFAMYQLVAYGRDQEREADIDGVEWMFANNMDTNGAPRLWEKVVDEQAAGGKESGFSLLATHPAPKERLTYLSSLSSDLRRSVPAGDGSSRKPESTPELLSLLEPYRMQWLADELAVQYPGQFAAIAASQLEFGISVASSKYMTAKSWINYARTKKGRELKFALDQATKSFAQGDAASTDMPPDAYRDWGKVNVRLGKTAAAKKLFEHYLNEQPDAWDAKFIRRELERL